MDDSPRYRWVVQGLLWFLAVATSLGGMSFSMMLPAMRRDLQITPMEIGLLTAFGSLVPAIVSLPIGAWVLRYSPKKSTAISIVLSGLFLFAQGWAPTTGLLIVTRVLFSVSTVIRQSAAPLIIQQWFAVREITRINSLGATIMVVGQIIAMGATSYLIIALGGWRPIYYLVGAFHLVFTVVWLIFGKDRVTAEYHAKDMQLKGTPFRALTKYPPLWVLSLCLSGAAGAWMSFLTYMPIFLTENRGTTLEEAGFLMVIFSFSSLFGTSAAGIVPDWLGRKKPCLYVAGAILTVSYMVIVSVPSIFVIGALLFVTGFFAYFVVPILNTIPFELPGITPREVTIGIALTHTIMPLTSASLPLLTGYLMQSTGSLQTALFVVSFAPLTLILFGLILPETGRKAREALSPTKGALETGHGSG